MARWVVAVATASVLIVVAVLLVVPWLLDTRAFRSYVTQTASRALGRPVKFESLSVSLFPRALVRLHRLEVADDPAFGSSPFLTVAEGRMRLRLRALLFGRAELVDLTLDRPAIHLVENERGRWNWASLGPAVAGASPAARSGARVASPLGAALVSRVGIVDGTLFYRRLGAPTAPDVRLERINVGVTRASAGAAIRLEGAALVEPGDVKLTLTDGSVTPPAVRSVVEIPIGGTIVVEASDIAPLSHAVVPEPTIGGAMKGRFAVSGTTARVVASGALGFDRLSLSEERAKCEPRRRQLTMSDVRIPVALAGTRLDSAPIEAALAPGRVSARLAVDLGSARLATLTDIAVQGVELEPILVGFLCHPWAVSGPLDLTGAAAVHLADPWRSASGSGRLRIGPGKLVGGEIVKLIRDTMQVAGVVDAVRRHAERGPSGSPLAFDSITGTYAIENGVVKTGDLLYQSAGVKVSAAGTYVLLDGRLDMNVRLIQGRNEIKGTVSGTPGALRVVPTGVRIQDAAAVRKLLDKLLR
jgi:uncharacterized protein involved in outer membrane biogenesis